MLKFSMFSGVQEKILEVGAEKAAEYAHRIGFSGIEPLHCDGLFTKDSLSVLKKSLESRKMTVPCYSVGVNLYGDAMDSGLKSLYEAIENASFLECPYLHHTLFCDFTNNAFDFSEAYPLISAAANKAAEYAKSLGVIVLYEDQGFYFNGVKNVSEILSSTKSNGTKICADFGNIMFVDENPEDFIRAFSADVRHVHIKDYKVKKSHKEGEKFYTTRNNRCLFEAEPFCGDVNFNECIKLLKEADYQGYYSFEFTSKNPEEFPALAKSVMKKLNIIYENI